MCGRKDKAMSPDWSVLRDWCEIGQQERESKWKGMEDESGEECVRA